MGAPLPPVPGVIRVIIGGTTGSNIWENVLHWQYSGSATSDASATALANGIATAWGTNMAPESPNPLALEHVNVVDLASISAPAGEWLGVIQGTRGDDEIPANAAVLISYPVGVRYKGGHPRQYLVALGNADLQDASHWSAAGTTEVQTHWRAFLAAVGSLSYGGTSLGTFCSVRYHGKFLPNEGPPHYYLTTPQVLAINAQQCLADHRMASQRRRIGRVRR